MVSTKQLVTIEAAAEYAGVSAKTIRRRIADRTIPAVRLGSRTIRIRIEDLDAALRPVPTDADGAGLE